MDSKQMRSPLARVVGFGSAKSGTEHWWAERVSAVVLVPLTLWFVAVIIVHTHSDYAGFVIWLKELPTTIIMVLLLGALFHHTALGLQVIVEDYVHSSLKFVAVLLIRFACFALALAGMLATLRIAWGGV